MRVTLFAGAALLALSGCGRAPQGANGRSDPQPSLAPDATVAYPQSDYVAAASGKPGGTLRLAAARDNGTLDAQLLADVNTKWLGRLITDNLVYLDDKGAITPWLARAWEVSPDGRTYVFHLRDGVTFSDGTPLDAAAVKINLDRIRDPRTHAAMTTAYIAPYEGSEARDRLTFVAHLRQPYAPFLNVLAQSWFGLISPRQIKEHPETIATAPIGSGPFVVTRYVRQQGVTLKRREDYNWAPPFIAHRGPALLDGIVIRIIPEPLARYAALASGEEDMIVDAPPQNLAALRADPAFVVRNRVNLGNPVRGIIFNVEKPPFDDVRVRRAVAQALDRTAIARLVGFGEFAPTTSFLSASTPYRDPAAGKGLAMDVAAADRLLDTAGWKQRGADGVRIRNGQRLQATALSTDANLLGQTIVAVQADLRRVGFDLRIEQITAATAAVRRRTGDYDALGAGFWHTNTPDGLFIAYHSDQISSDRFVGQNLSRLRDPILDDLLSRARRGGDPPALKDLYSAAQRRLAELVPAVPLFENHTLVAYRRGVTGVIFDTSHNTPLFDNVSLQGDGR